MDNPAIQETEEIDPHFSVCDTIVLLRDHRPSNTVSHPEKSSPWVARFIRRLGSSQVITL
jgi:hypothetical protein